MQYIFTEQEYQEVLSNKIIAEISIYNQKAIENYFINNCARKKNGYCDNCPIASTQSINDNDKKSLFGNSYKCLAGIDKEHSK